MAPNPTPVTPTQASSNPAVPAQQRPRALVCFDLANLVPVYGEDFTARLGDRVDFITEPLSAQDLARNPAVMSEAELLFTTWGGPYLDENLLAHAPNLKMVLHAAGTIRGLMTPAAWERGIRISSAYAANAVPVAEMTVSQIVFCLKFGYQQIARYRELRTKPPLRDTPGTYGSTVGVVSLGTIGRMVCEKLKALDVEVIAYDPFASVEQARALGVELVGLDELFRRSEVVTLHTPSLPETRGMINRGLIASLKPNASLINTSRGAVVDEPGLIEVLAQRQDLAAVLDVTDPEPPVPDSPLWSMDNVVLLPHVAGSLGGERARMGQLMVDEMELYLAGKPLNWEITQKSAQIMA